MCNAEKPSRPQILACRFGDYRGFEKKVGRCLRDYGAARVGTITSPEVLPAEPDTTHSVSV